MRIKNFEATGSTAIAALTTNQREDDSYIHVRVHTPVDMPHAVFMDSFRLICALKE